MGIFVIGLNHHECPVAIREKLHFSPSVSESVLGRFKEISGLTELLILSTCNRVELYGFCEEAVDAKEEVLKIIHEVHGIDREVFESFLYRHEGRDAIRHIFRVAAGLDSLVVGEYEILGQFRDAFKLASQQHSVDSIVYRLMEKALKLGKDVRAKTHISQGAVSIPAVAVELAEKIFGKLSGQKVMVLGTGEMSALTLKNLKNAGGETSYIISRNPERGTALAEEFDARWLSIDEWRPFLAEVDILIASTAAPHAIVHYEHIKEVMAKRRARPLFLIDIAVPRDIDPQVDGLEDVYLYNIDDLKGVSASNLRLRKTEIIQAENFVDQAIQSFYAWMEQLKARPALERFENFVDQLLDKELNELVKKEHISIEQKDQIRHRMRSKLTYHPMERVKEASRNGGVHKYIEALHSLFGLDKKE
ncbi:MAG: glutamyl-tRNA reductase [Candidatus Omnitrophica bacterium]|nr:glutamyl-tRNA reductase [Candidatus Omnitrophota bacterium]